MQSSLNFSLEPTQDLAWVALNALLQQRQQEPHTKEAVGFATIIILLTYIDPPASVQLQAIGFAFQSLAAAAN